MQVLKKGWDTLPPQAIIDRLIHCGPLGHKESPETFSGATEANVSMDGDDAYYQARYGCDRISAELATEALCLGHGQWEKAIYDIVPDLREWIAGAEVERKPRAWSLRVTALTFSPDVVHVRMDDVWFDLDGIEAVRLLDGYSYPLAAQMVVDWDWYDNGGMERARGIGA
jgi:hypothetical protein